MLQKNPAEVKAVPVASLDNKGLSRPPESQDYDQVLPAAAGKTLEKHSAEGTAFYYCQLHQRKEKKNMFTTVRNVCSSDNLLSSSVSFLARYQPMYRPPQPFPGMVIR